MARTTARKRREDTLKFLLPAKEIGNRRVIREALEKRRRERAIADSMTFTNNNEVK